MPAAMSPEAVCEMYAQAELQHWVSHWLEAHQEEAFQITGKHAGEFDFYYYRTEVRVGNPRPGSNYWDVVVYAKLNKGAENEREAKATLHMRCDSEKKWGGYAHMVERAPPP
eukprot:TRINITY_DN4475_c0_g1_i1.p3 TRINITY_DN4475_c0_g1~~TRINITY_DN4475_c0_g1_i1.p3  ORF type:complete len:112 (+),score=38.11 TRINITY_DN4475_c0_g1_i1:61-396(+)